MSLLILSKNIVDQKDTLSSIVFSAIKSDLRVVLNEKCINTEGTIEVYMDRHYGKVDIENLECFSFDIHSTEFVKRQFDQKLVYYEFNNSRYYALAGSDQTEHEKLVYDFSLQYLRLNPNHVISLYGEKFLTLSDIEKIEMNNNYTDKDGLLNQ